MPETSSQPERPERQVRQRGRTREAILHAARSLYQREGYGAVTMRAIANQLGFSAPAIYNYFLSKEEIFVVLQETALRHMAAAVIQPETDDPVHDLRMLYWHYFEFSKQEPDYFTLVYVDPSVPTVESKFEGLKAMTEFTAKIVKRCLDAGVFPSGTPELVGPLLWNIIHGPAVLRLVQGLPRSLNYDIIAASALDLAIAGLRAGLLPEIAMPQGIGGGARTR